MLDGDIVRQNLTKGLGFSKKDRSTNIRRVGFVANEITKNGGFAICSCIAPYEVDRDFNRKLIEKEGNYIEVFVSTSLQTCMDRDVKGLYAKVKQGLIKNFTGISDPYEAPEKAEIEIETSAITIDESVEIILNYLKENNYLPSK
jgi:sulfate adenylyltransferase